MTGTPDNFASGTEDALEARLRDAFLENDCATVKETIMAPGCPNHIKGSALRAAVATGSLMMVRIVFDSKPELTAGQGMLLLLSAANKQQADIVALLCEKNVALDILRRDSYAVVFTKFSEEKLPAAIDAILKTTADRQDALDSMLPPAAEDKKLSVISGLIDQGARFGDKAVDTLAKLTIGVNQTAFYTRKDDYLTLMEKCAAITPAGYLADTYAGVSAMMATSGLQYSETAEAFLRHGADPYFTFKNYNLDKHLPPQSPLRATFAAYEETYTAAQRQLFRGLFGDAYTLADLRQEVEADGSTGLMLAARARLLPDVMRQGGITPDDLLRQNQRGQDLLTLAAARGDAGVVLDAGYWRRTSPRILETLDNAVPDEVKNWADYKGFVSRLDHAALKEQAQKFKLKPKGPTA
jgi:hypothetical protein